MSLVNYHKSINAELSALKDRVRDLIAPNRQWAEDGRHKEVILQQILHRHVPESLRVGTGFVRLRESCSNQQDILITNTHEPVLFEEGGFQIVSVDKVEAIIEVKTKLNLTTLRESLEKIAKNVSKIRNEKIANIEESNRIRAYYLQNERGGRPFKTDPWAGLFVFEECELDPQEVVNVVRDVCQKQISKTVQAICLGPDAFIRFWPNGQGSHPKWEYYKLENLAYSYFIGNTIWRNIDNMPGQEHWFPLAEGKSPYLLASAELEPPYS